MTKAQISRMGCIHMELKVGDLVEMKKQHPCGNSIFTVLRIGADIKLQCKGCGRIIMDTKAEMTKRIKKLVQPQE